MFSCFLWVTRRPPGPAHHFSQQHLERCDACCHGSAPERMLHSHPRVHVRLNRRLRASLWKLRPYPETAGAPGGVIIRKLPRLFPVLPLLPRFTSLLYHLYFLFPRCCFVTSFPPFLLLLPPSMCAASLSSLFPRVRLVIPSSVQTSHPCLTADGVDD